jgi:hypothetical protein
MTRGASRGCMGLAVVLTMAFGWVDGARAEHLVAVRGEAVTRYTPGGGWAAMSTPIHRPIDGIAYDDSRRAYVVSIGAPGPCSFVEFRSQRVIASMNQAQFRRASGTSLTANCELHEDPSGGVLISAGFETLGSETSWSLNIVSGRAVSLGYGYAATTDGHDIALVQHTYFPPPELGSAELLAAGAFGRPETLHRIVPMSERYGYATPALSISGDRFAAFRDSSLIMGRLGGRLRALRRLPQAGVPYDLQWSDSGSDLFALTGPEGGPSGTLSLIDPSDGHEQPLASGVTSFATTP